MDSTLNQAFAALLTLAQASQTDLPVSRGPLSPAPGIALEPDPSAPAAQHMDGGCVIVLDIVINGKAADRHHQRKQPYPERADFVRNIYVKSNPHESHQQSRGGHKQKIVEHCF